MIWGRASAEGRRRSRRTRSRVEQGELDAAAILLPGNRTFDDMLSARCLGRIKLAVVAQKGMLKKRARTLAECQSVSISNFKPLIDIWLVQPRVLGKLQQPVDRFGAAIEQQFKEARAQRAA